ncbi:hypothetical protein ACET3Z_010073 [Daucus carota]
MKEVSYNHLNLDSFPYFAREGVSGLRGMASSFGKGCFCYKKNEIVLLILKSIASATAASSAIGKDGGKTNTDMVVISVATLVVAAQCV